MPNMEQIVRPFQTTTTIVNRRSNVTKPTKVAPQKAIITWGAEGQAPVSQGITINVKNTDNKYQETSRKTTDVRVENPDDSNQFVIEQRVDKVTFTKPAATSPSNTVGNGPEPSSSVAYAGSTPEPLANPTVTTGVTQTAKDEVHSFTLVQPA